MKRTEKGDNTVDALVSDVLMRSLRNIQPDLLSRFAKIQDAKARTLDLELKRLESEKENNQSEIDELERRKRFAIELTKAVETKAIRVRRRPRPSEGDWVVHGRVRNPDGKAASGLCVNLIDKDRKYDKALGEMMTDEFGEFCFLYHKKHFTDFIEHNPDIEIEMEITDEAGHMVFESKEPLHWKSNHVDYFKIRLDSRVSCAKK